MTIASLLQQRYTITQIAQRLKRSAGIISRELKRNAKDGCYTSQVATPVPASDAEVTGQPKSCMLMSYCLMQCIIF